MRDSLLFRLILIFYGLAKKYTDKKTEDIPKLKYIDDGNGNITIEEE